MRTHRLQSTSQFIALLASSAATNRIGARFAMASTSAGHQQQHSVAFCSSSRLMPLSSMSFMSSASNTPNGSGGTIIPVIQLQQPHQQLWSKRINNSKPTLTQRSMSFFGSSPEGSGTPRINKDAMIEIIEDVSNSSREESGYVIIDVRGHDEVQMTGKLADVVETLPLPLIAEGALIMDDDEFQEKYGFEKPRLDETIVFTCKAGVRSASAAQLARMAGYTDILDYMGGSNEWFS